MQYIEIKGEEYPVQFGTALMKRLGNKYKLQKIVQAEQLISSIQWDDLDWILFEGIANAAKLLGDDVPVTKEDVTAYVDADLTVMGRVLTILTNDLNPKEDEAEEEDEDDEKKAKAAPTFKK